MLNPHLPLSRCPHLPRLRCLASALTFPLLPTPSLAFDRSQLRCRCIPCMRLSRQCKCKCTPQLSPWCKCIQRLLPRRAPCRRCRWRSRWRRLCLHQAPCTLSRSPTRRNPRCRRDPTRWRHKCHPWRLSTSLCTEVCRARQTELLWHRQARRPWDETCGEAAAPLAGPLHPSPLFTRQIACRGRVSLTPSEHFNMKRSAATQRQPLIRSYEGVLRSVVVCYKK